MVILWGAGGNPARPPWALTCSLQAGWLPATRRQKEPQFPPGPSAISLHTACTLLLTGPEILETSLLHFTCTHGHPRTTSGLTRVRSSGTHTHSHKQDTWHMHTLYTCTRVLTLVCNNPPGAHAHTCTQVRAVTHPHTLLLDWPTNMQPLFVHTSIFAHSHYTHLAS